MIVRLTTTSSLAADRWWEDYVMFFSSFEAEGHVRSGGCDCVAEDSAVVQPVGHEWMYELEAVGTSVCEWEVYNKAGLAFHRVGGGADAAVLELRTGAAGADHTALFTAAAAASQVLNFRTRVEPHRSMYCRLGWHTLLSAHTSSLVDYLSAAATVLPPPPSFRLPPPPLHSTTSRAHSGPVNCSRVNAREKRQPKKKNTTATTSRMKGQGKTGSRYSEALK